MKQRFVIAGTGSRAGMSIKSSATTYHESCESAAQFDQMIIVRAMVLGCDIITDKPLSSNHAKA